MLLKELYRPQTWLEEMVYNLLQHHGIEQPDDIDLNVICNTFRVEVWYAETRSRTYPHPLKDGWHVILVDNRVSVAEQREKIAHELGHLILHVGVQPDLPELMIVSQEFQTNHFVEHLLVPFYMFDQLAYKVTLYDAPMYIARLFRVSEKLAKKRFDRFLSRMYVRGYAHYI
jgi:hypothetical protein